VKSGAGTLYVEPEERSHGTGWSASVLERSSWDGFPDSPGKQTGLGAERTRRCSEEEFTVTFERAGRA